MRPSRIMGLVIAGCGTSADEARPAPRRSSPWRVSSAIEVARPLGGSLASRTPVALVVVDLNILVFWR